MKGVYALLIKVKRPVVIEIGHLGRIRFPKGHYVYIGSALSRLETRIARHLRRKKKLRWHIDYLLSSLAAEIEWIATKRTSKKLECEINKRLEKFASAVIGGFGCSDCGCRSHLSYFGDFKLCAKILKREFGLGVEKKKEGG